MSGSRTGIRTGLKPTILSVSDLTVEVEVTRAHLARVELSERDVMRVAAEASVDPRTVRRYMAKRAVRRLAAERISLALAELGLVDGPAKADPKGVP